MTNRSILDITKGVSIEKPEPVTVVDGIYHNPSLGLITLGDGNGNVLTISDKNIGATQVYGSGSILTEANSGGFFQWGNNYMFPFSGDITTSTTQVDASDYGPGNYYNNSIFIKDSINWDSSNNDNLRGDATDTLEARQGPCNSGYHVPNKNELDLLINILSSLGIDTSNGDCLQIYLKFPTPGYISMYGVKQTEGSPAGIVWSTSFKNSSSTTSYRLYYYGRYLGVSLNYRSEGCSIRPFKNSVVYPDNTWIKLYPGLQTEPGIYHSSALGLISISSDGVNRTTMSDKNLGATQVYNTGDIMSEANCGKYFQRGNNYGFSFSGDIITSEDTVDASSYGPGNYYNSSTFINIAGNWDNSNNDNLRGDITDTIYARRGPCPEGYRIPKEDERENLRDKWRALGGGAFDGAGFSTALKLPMSGYRDTDSSIKYQGTTGMYWDSNIESYESYIDYHFSDYLAFSNNNLRSWNRGYRSLALPIRPFKNESVIPDTTRTKLY